MQTGYSRSSTQSDVQFDLGLRKLMLTMYNHTASGLAVSGAVAWLTYSSGLMYAMGGLMFVAMFAPLGMIFWYSFAGQNWDQKTWIVLLRICNTDGAKFKHHFCCLHCYEYHTGILYYKCNICRC